ncbi:QueT transporter family protein [Halorussus marinus]|uniref:QueT transporter family protein n=1 Tax=Halorussus marinus TaxID=2505976 RepID=UPI001FCEE0CD|nr:QueT transporter family protein [Halorussus marinus]
MRETITMWRDTRMIMLVAVVAALFAAVLIPFKALTIVPGVTEIRPANAIPVAFGIMFGPAGAWGVAIGNLIGDIFGGTFGPGSAFGFAGNFFFALVSYKLWGNLAPLSSGEEPTMDSARQVAELWVIALAGAAVCAAIIAWGLEVLGQFPFSVLGPVIALNNFLAAAVLGPPLLYLTYPRVREMGLLYPDVMDAPALSDASSSRSTLAAFGLAAVSIAWLVIGVGLSVGLGGGAFIGNTAETFGQGGSTPQIALGAVAFVALFGLSALSKSRLPAALSAR